MMMASPHACCCTLNADVSTTCAESAIAPHFSSSLHHTIVDPRLLMSTDVAAGSLARAIPRRGDSTAGSAASSPASATPGIRESPPIAIVNAAGGPAQLTVIAESSYNEGTGPNDMWAPMGTPIPPATSEHSPSRSPSAKPHLR